MKILEIKMSDENVIKLDFLIGKKIRNVYVSEDEVIFRLNNNETNETITYTFTHFQECCENVFIEEIEGDLNNLCFETILDAEIFERHEDEFLSQTFTILKFRTKRDSYSVMWKGESNGYYSESISCIQKKEKILL